MTVPPHLYALAWALTVAAASPAVSAESRYALGYRLEYSDNVKLVESGAESELISIPSLYYELQTEAPDWDADVLADLQFEDFTTDAFDDRWTGVVDANLSWYIVPEYITWVVSDFFRQVTVASVRAATPRNQQLVNTFTTGPDIRVRLSPVDDLQAEYRLTDIYEERTTNDSMRNSFALRWHHRLSSVATASLNYEFSDVDFDDPANADFRRHDYFARYQSAGPRSDLSVDVGRTQVDRINAPDSEGRLFRSTVAYRLSRVSDLTLALQDILIETGYIAATQGNLAELAATTGTFTSTDIYRERLADLAYGRQARVTAFSASLFTLTRDYTIDRTQDRRVSGARIRINYDPSAVTRISLYGVYQDSVYHHRPARPGYRPITPVPATPRHHAILRRRTQEAEEAEHGAGFFVCRKPGHPVPRVPSITNSRGNRWTASRPCSG